MFQRTPKCSVNSVYEFMPFCDSCHCGELWTPGQPPAPEGGEQGGGGGGGGRGGGGGGGGGGQNWLGAAFSGGARGPRSHGGVAVALGPKRARPKTLPPTNFRGEACQL